MKKFFIAIYSILLASFTLSFGQQIDQSEVHDINESVARFWERDRVDLDVKNHDEFSKKFMQFLMLTPAADYNVIMSTIDTLIKRFNKNPEGLLQLAQIAEENLYDPNSFFKSDDFYLPFLEAVTRAKKIPAAEKSRYNHQLTTLTNSKVGELAPSLPFQTIDGKKDNLQNYIGKYVILFINDPECEDCALARIRLSTNSTINRFIDKGDLALISLYPDEADEEWRESAAKYNPRWTVGYNANVDDIIDLRNTPSLYYFDKQTKLLSKTITVEQLIDGFDRIGQKGNIK